MREYDLVIIGAGISGMTAALSALEDGIKDILIIEKEETFGGILNQCIHNDFGSGIIEEIVTGPELIQEIKERLDKFEYEIKLKTYVLKVLDDNIISYVNEIEGICEIKAKAIMLATGCREKYTGNILIPTNKYLGVFTVGNAHRLINLEGLFPGKRPVITANSKWALILARRVQIEGGEVAAVIISNDCGFKLDDEDRSLLDGFNIEVIEDSKLIEVKGKKRINKVKIKNEVTNEEKEIDCDSLFLSVGYYPEIGIVKDIDIKIDSESKIPYVENYKTSKEGIFACGNLIYGSECINRKDLNGYIAGKEVAKYLKDNFASFIKK